MGRRKKENVRNIVVVSDTHCGCRLGLCPPNGATLDDGGNYQSSDLQKKVWSWWEEFWSRVVPEHTHGEPYCVVVNGDMVEGAHHRATSQISHNLEDQCEIAYQVFAPIVTQCEGRFYMIRGTPAHVGEQGKEEEQLAKRLGAIPNDQGQRSRYELWKWCGELLVHFNHHIGTTSSAQHETSAINAELAHAFVEAGRWGRKPPNIVVRSHRHRCAEVRIPSRHGYSISFVTAAWQLKTPFLFKVAGGRQTTPQIGGHIIRQVGNHPEIIHWIREISRSEPE